MSTTPTPSSAPSTAPPATHVAAPLVPRWCTACPLLGRILLSAIFLLSGVQKIVDWDGTREYMAAQGMIWIPVFLVGAIVLEIAGGLSLLLGCRARLGATLLIVFLISTTFVFHAFWTYEGQEQQTQMIHFMKNLAILGGLLQVLAFGAGPLAWDAKSSRTRPATD